MERKAIGVFDSGLGGLTAVKQLLSVLPNEDIVYFGDTGRVPYGNRSNDTIKKYAVQDAKFLLSHNVKMVIAACGTVSSVAGDLKDTLGVPYTGVVNPTVYTAVRTTKNKRVGVIGTSATIGSHSYKKDFRKRTRTSRFLNRTVLSLFPLWKTDLSARMTPSFI
ncbi:MAG: aspartate/glutamate racemase family protein [Ruminococcus sp.]|nr:aspartate/glutamate racemase family protein [Ruminococcus sp.]